MEQKKRVYTFGNGKAEGNAQMREQLGGKGANCAEMNLIGVPVPPGFTITTDVCNEYYEVGQEKIMELLNDDVIAAVHHIEGLMNSKFGDPQNPLLVSVRSGARASMPGMMDTILNLGLNDIVAEGMVKKTNNPHFVYDSYRRFVQMYGDVVLGMKPVNKTDIDPFEKIIEEVKEKSLEGELAELGVYRAEFSKWMNAEFPDKRLFLFDTFESFKDEDVEQERSNNFTPDVLIEKYRMIFHNTNEEYVMSQMKYPANCVIRKGYFPETIPDEEITYSLVSLDCDLYVPTLSGLEYFYPRLERGGFIIIHDYNHEDHWMGVKKAVKEYEKVIGHIAKIPLADNCGSLVITK